MFRSARQLCTLSLLFAYGLIAVGGEGLHAVYHACGEASHRFVAETASADTHSGCSHSHAGAHSHDDPAETSDDGQDVPHPTEHDEDDCLLCQHLAQAQADLPSVDVAALAEPVSATPTLSRGVRSIAGHFDYECRGPPCC
jgi:hypothetical protein